MGIKEKFGNFGKKNDLKLDLKDANNGESATDDNDDAPNYIKKDDKEDQAKKDSSKMSANIMDELKSVISSIVKSLEGVRPQGYQQRSLDNEKGGVEKEESKDIEGANAENDGEEYADYKGRKKRKKKEESQDVWDERPDQIKNMIKKTQDLNNASTSSREQSVIGTDAKIKKLLRKNKHHANDHNGGAGGKHGAKVPKESFLERIQNRKEASQHGTISQNGDASSNGGFYQDNNYSNEGNNNGGGYER